MGPFSSPGPFGNYSAVVAVAGLAGGLAVGGRPLSGAPALAVLAIAGGLMAALLSETRSAWTALPLMALAVLTMPDRRAIPRRWVITGVVSALLATLLASELVGMRLAEGISEVRAYLADGIDEFLAHLTMLEAALGTVRDYPPRPKPDPHKHLGGATQRMAARVSRLLGSPDHGKMYSRLFDQRSAFLHGRPVQPISVEDRVSARRLARRVVLALIEVAGASAISSREDWLDALLANAAGSRSTR